MHQSLLLLVLIGLCLDFVLVNVQEIVSKVDASYGFVVMWDMVTFFAWARVVDLCSAEKQTAFRTSAIVAVAPLFALGREILFLPYATFSARMYLDLVMGNTLVSLWMFVPGRHRAAGTRVFAMLVLVGCAYWLLNAVENIAFLVWSPLAPALFGALARAGIADVFVSVMYAGVALVVTVLISRANVFGLGSKFGVAN